VAADDFRMPVSYARHLGDFCNVCSNIAPISSSVFFRSAHCVY
jgi:hypothetical protein